MIDYRAIGLKSGLEIHQQLSSRTKLYCCCPNEIRKAEDSDFEFFRYLRPGRARWAKSTGPRPSRR